MIPDFFHLIYCSLQIREGNGNLLQYSCLENPVDCSLGSQKSDTTQRLNHNHHHCIVSILACTHACYVASVVSNSATLWTVARCPLDSSSKNAGVGCHALLWGIFLTQGSNLCLLCLLYWEVVSLPVVPSRKPQYLGILADKFLSLNLAPLCRKFYR